MTRQVFFLQFFKRIVVQLFAELIYDGLEHFHPGIILNQRAIIDQVVLEVDDILVSVVP